MGDLSDNFSRKEFACQCGCGQDTVDAKLLEVLQRLRTHFAFNITVTSGNRCKVHNKSVGGSDNSQHLYGKAADIKVRGLSPEEVYRALDLWFPHSLGIGLYESWVHVDSRQEKGRW